MRDLLLGQDVYDCNNTHIYSTSSHYDERRNLVCQTDPLGQITTMSYDAHRNKIREEQVGSGYHTLFVYDLCDRLVQTVEKHDDGQVFITKYAYDVLGNKIGETDHYGNQTNYHTIASDAK